MNRNVSFQCANSNFIEVRRVSNPNVLHSLIYSFMQIVGNVTEMVWKL